MKKYLVFIIFIVSFSYSQEDFSFRIFNPSFTKNMFSSSAEDAAGIALNPATHGIPQHNNIFLNTTIFKNKIYENSVYMHTKISNIGFGFNFRNSYDSLRKNTLYTIGYSLGYGNDKYAIGLGVDYSWHNRNFSSAKSLYNFGIILRPLRYLSLSYSLLNAGWKPILGKEIRATNIFGFGVRPLGNNLLSLFFDYEYDTNLKPKDTPYKLGGEVKILKGIFLSATLYDMKQNIGKNYALGFRFDFPHTGIKSSNILNQDKINNGVNIGVNLSTAVKPSLIPLKKKIAEVVVENNYNDYDEKGTLFSKSVKGLQTLINEINRAAEDEDVGGLLILIKNFSTPYAIFGMNAGLEELVAAVNRVKSKGKPVIAFIESMAGLHEIYLASSANKIVVPQYGFISGYGITYNNLKFKYTLKKFGIDIKTYTAGKYKSSLNQMSDTLSEAKIEEINSLIDDLYAKMTEQIKSNRGISDGMIDSLSGIIYPEQALNAGLIDMIGWYEDAKKEIYRMVRGETIEKGEQVRTLKIAERKYWNEYWDSPPKIVVIGIYGTIVQGESQPPSPIPIPFLSSGRSTGSKTVIRQIEKAVRDKNVKAIIIRVDSPGGDGIASDDIYRAIVKAREEKPVIVSMGSLAASGGYYVSSHGATCFANPTTLTGSIGVISQVPFLYDLFQKYDVYTKSFNRGSFSDYFNIYAEPKPEAEKMLNEALENFYKGFIKRISEGRKLTEEEVKLVAQGRIWTGRQALERRLIDRLGTLYDAIEFAKEVAKVKGDCRIEFYSVPSISFGLGSILMSILN